MPYTLSYLVYSNVQSACLYSIINPTTTTKGGRELHQGLDEGLACNSEISEENGLTVVPTPSFHAPPPAMVASTMTSLVSDAFAVDSLMGDDNDGSGGNVGDGASGDNTSPGPTTVSGASPDPSPGLLRDLDAYHFSWCDPSYDAPAVRFVCLPLLYEKAPLLWCPANLEVPSKHFFTQPSCILDNFLYLSAQVLKHYSS